MRKLVLNLEALEVESFDVSTESAYRGTVDAASDGTLPSDGCPATMLLSGCQSHCRPSGPHACLSPPPC